jgi:hypothetical protein
MAEKRRLWAVGCGATGYRLQAAGYSQSEE